MLRDALDKRRALELAKQVTSLFPRNALAWTAMALALAQFEDGAERVRSEWGRSGYFSMPVYRVLMVVYTSDDGRCLQALKVAEAALGHQPACLTAQRGIVEVYKYIDQPKQALKA